jgi:hypothetical protein
MERLFIDDMSEGTCGFPGLLAVGLSAIAFDIFFLPSPLPLSSDPSSYLRFAVFVLAALTASQLMEAKKRIVRVTGGSV